MTALTSLTSADVRVGDVLPDLTQERGSADIFINILTSNGIVGRFVTDWAGPAARLKKVAIRLGVPSYAGDTLVVSGEVTALDGNVAEVAVKGMNRLGAHVTGTVTVELPEAAA
jgi:hypothetical protein